MDEERVELEADIKKLHHTLEEDRNQWQYDYIVDSDDDDESEDDDDALFIDLDKQGSAAASVTSLSARSAGGRTPSSAPSVVSQPTSATESQSLATEQDDDAELFREVGVMQEELDAVASLPATLESCLVLNRAYQDVISKHISRIELELAENREAQRHIEEEAKESSLQQMTKKRFPYNATLPYFKMKFGSTPAQNEDTRLKRLTDEPDLDKRPEKTWHGRQRRMLTEAVIEDSLEKLLQPLLSRRELEEEKLKDVGKNTEQWQEITNRISRLDVEIEEKRGTPREELLHSVDPEKVDWMKIANMTFEGKRDWMACHRAWVHSLDPSLNQQPWTHAEEERLANLVSETNGTNWIYVAQQLGTGRTPFQCLQYFQQNLNSEMLDRPWTKEEDDQLIKVVEKCQHYHFNWRKVSHYMEGRSGMQCYKRYSRLDPNINKGHWTEAEDAQLMTAVQLLGTHNWGRVKELVPGRTREQCRERYANSLDPSISGQPWTYEEDKKLLNLVAREGKGNWVRCCKDLPGRTDNQVLQRYRRLEDWRKKTEWFKKQSHKDRDLLQGNNLPGDQRAKAQEKNWEQFRNKFGVVPDDYVKQKRDIENGDMVVPRPPFMIGLANKSGCKVWERRIKLHKLIESHIDRLKEKYNFIHPSVAGVFELQDAISQLSKDCLSQRDQLMNKRKDRLGQLIHGLPSVISVKDLLAVSRGGKVQEKRTRGPMLGKKRNRVKKTLPPRLQQSMKIDTELRQIVRANLKDRSLKKGRPRRFFWDITGDQVLSDEEIAELKATAFSLYLKSLGADHVEMLRAGRRAYPQLFHKLQQQQLQDSEEDQKGDHPGPSHAQPLRRSRRRYEKMQAESESQENADPFSLSGLRPNSAGFAEWQRQRDYELLEWLAKEQNILVDDQLSEGMSKTDDIPTAASVEVSTGSGSGSSATGEQSGRSVIGHGMSLVHARIQEAAEEEEAARQSQGPAQHSHNSTGFRPGETVVIVDSDEDANNETKGHDDSRTHRTLTDGDGNISKSTAVRAGTSWSVTSSHQDNRVQSSGNTTLTQNRQNTPRQQQQQQVTRAAPARQLPNLPPTLNSVQSFKNLLLKRLGLIKKAGAFYNLPYYMAQKDQQVAQLIQTGNRLQEMNRGTIDLSRMMNRVSQETDFVEPHKWKKRKDKPEDSESVESRNADHRVLGFIRKTEEFQLLQARFLSVFTWPAVLSAIYPPFERKEFSHKAGGKSYFHKPPGEELPAFQSLRKKLPLLKSKGFYRYANKSKEEKEKRERLKEQRRILRQVQELMADEDDPNPHVTMDPDSDDDAGGDNEPGPSKRPADSEPDPVPKKKRQPYKRRDPTAQPVRQSSRVMQKKTYVDSINRKRMHGPRKPWSVRVPEPPKAAVKRPSRLHPSVRMAMIDAIVENHNKSAKRKHGTQLGHWNPGGYESDEDHDDVEKELERGGEWVEALPSELQDNLALLERESIVEDMVVDAADASTAVTSTAVTFSTMAAHPPKQASTHIVYTSVHSHGLSHLPGNSGINQPSRDLPSAAVSVARSLQRSKSTARPTQAVGQTALPETSRNNSSQPTVANLDVSSSHMTVNSQMEASAQQQRGVVPEVVLLDSDEDEPSVASQLAARRGSQ